jgi:hypothetical protein
MDIAPHIQAELDRIKREKLEREAAAEDEERIERIFETQNERWPGNSPPDDDDAYNVQPAGVARGKQRGL